MKHRISIVCPSPATNATGESLAARAAVGQGVCTIPGQSGAGMLRDHMGRNHGAWLSIAVAAFKFMRKGF